MTWHLFSSVQLSRYAFCINCKLKGFVFGLKSKLHEKHWKCYFIVNSVVSCMLNRDYNWHHYFLFSYWIIQFAPETSSSTSNLQIREFWKIVKFWWCMSCEIAKTKFHLVSLFLTHPLLYSYWFCIGMSYAKCI